MSFLPRFQLWLLTHRWAPVVAMIVAVCALITAAQFIDTAQPIGSVLHGSMTGYQDVNGGVGKMRTPAHQRLIAVRLDSGASVTIDASYSLPEYREGARVLVREYATSILHTHTYRYEGAEETPARPPPGPAAQ